MARLPDADISLAPRFAADALCKDLLEGMHAASQPLTILRASLGAPDVARQTDDDLRKLLRRSSKEVDRLCVLFSYLQQFVMVGSIKAEPEIEDLSQLMEHTLEGVDLLFAQAGMVLKVKRGRKKTAYVFVDSSRLEQALSGIFLVILGRGHRGDEVTMKTQAAGARIEINLTSALAPSAMGAETRLSMALAAANLRSQGARMSWKDQPFAVQIDLPITKMDVLT